MNERARKSERVIRNGPIVLYLGAAISVVSLADSLVASVTSKEQAQLLSIRQELMEKYGVTTTCTSVGSGFGADVMCYDSVKAGKRDEVLQDYYTEFKEREETIVPDEEAQRRTVRGDIGFFFGMIVAAIGERMGRK